MVTERELLAMTAGMSAVATFLRKAGEPGLGETGSRYLTQGSANA